MEKKQERTQEDCFGQMVAEDSGHRNEARPDGRR